MEIEKERDLGVQRRDVAEKEGERNGVEGGGGRKENEQREGMQEEKNGRGKKERNRKTYKKPRGGN